MALLRLSIICTLIIFMQTGFADKAVGSPLIETNWLAENLDNVVVLDILLNDKNFTTPPKFKTDDNLTLVKMGGHIPGARLIFYKNVRGDRIIDGKTIKHMVITVNQFEKLLQKAGVNQNDHIVITTNAESAFDLTMATRMFWQVKYFGHNEVSLLNGGTSQWLIDGHKASTTLNKHTQGNWKSKSIDSSIIADSEETMSASIDSNIQLVDVRPLGQYLGSFKSGKAKTKGHIPTAKVFPVDLLSTRKSPIKFLSEDELKLLSNALNISPETPLITYCNSGHMASGAWFAFTTPR